MCRWGRIKSDSDELVRHLYHEAAKSVGYADMDPVKALQLVTLNPAIQLGVDEWTGTLEVGKDADLVLMDGDPLSVATVGAATNGTVVDNGDGTVTDTEQHLMWAATDNNGDIDWHQAFKWVRYTFPFTLPVSYDNWRLPTLAELQSLAKDYQGEGYEADCGQRVKLTPLIRLSCGWVWSSGTSAIRSCSGCNS